MPIRANVYAYNFEISKLKPRHYESRMNVSFGQFLRASAAKWRHYFEMKYDRRFSFATHCRLILDR